MRQAGPVLVRVVRGVDVAVGEKERGDEGTKAANEREVHRLRDSVVPEMEQVYWKTICNKKDDNNLRPLSKFGYFAGKTRKKMLKS